MRRVGIFILTLTMFLGIFTTPVSANLGGGVYTDFLNKDKLTGKDSYESVRDVIIRSMGNATFEKQRMSIAKIDVEATAYAPYTGPENGMDYAGDRSQGSMMTVVSPYRTIAVDPKVIPYGSLVYVHASGDKDYVNGLYLAEDTGGAIKGNKIDILIENIDEANKFGRVKLKVGIVKEGKSMKAHAFTQDLAENWGKVLVENKEYVGNGNLGYGSNRYVTKKNRDEVLANAHAIFGTPLNESGWGDSLGSGEVIGEKDDGQPDWNPEKQEDMVIGTGVDDRKVEGVGEVGYFAKGFISGLVGNVMSLVQAVAVLVLGFTIIFLVLCILANTGIYQANTLVLKLSGGRIDVADAGLSGIVGKSFIVILVLVILVSGLLPSIFALIYDITNKLLGYLMDMRPVDR